MIGANHRPGDCKPRFVDAPPRTLHGPRGYWVYEPCLDCQRAALEADPASASAPLERPEPTLLGLPVVEGVLVPRAELEAMRDQMQAVLDLVRWDALSQPYFD